MNDDTISRRAAVDVMELLIKDLRKDTVDVMNFGHNYNHGVADAIATLKHLPSEERWISITERLPELYTDVLLSVRQGYAFGEPDNWCVVGQLIDKLDITWATNYGFHDVLYSNGIKHTVWVSAWMPLPEPYKGGEEE